MTCLKCGKEHLGECLQGKGVCYKCGKPIYFVNDCKGVCYNYRKVGHLAKNCNKEKKTTLARVYTMSKKEAKDSSTVVSGTYNLQLSTFIN